MPSSTIFVYFVTIDNLLQYVSEITLSFQDKNKKLNPHFIECMYILITPISYYLSEPPCARFAVQSRQTYLFKSSKGKLRIKLGSERKQVSFNLAISFR